MVEVAIIDNEIYNKLVSVTKFHINKNAKSVDKFLISWYTIH